MAVLDRYQAGKVALLADGSVPGGVTFASTERTGGVSQGCHASLNLGDACGDEPSPGCREPPACPCGHRRGGVGRLPRGAPPGPRGPRGPRDLRRARGASRQKARGPRGRGRRGLHGAARARSAVLCGLRARRGLRAGRLCRRALRLARHHRPHRRQGGPRPHGRDGLRRRGAARLRGAAHLRGGLPRVSSELMERFVGEFGPAVDAGGRHLDLGLAVRAALVETGVPEGSIASCNDSTASNVGRSSSRIAPRRAGAAGTPPWPCSARTRARPGGRRRSDEGAE